jgi:sulfur relay (sulfurtransferase) DsrC/TusE family protein
MTTTMIAETSVDVDAEGFLTDLEQWNERYLTTGTAPSIRSLGKESGVPIKELYQLFPKGPAKLAAKIGGIPKPRGCI